MKPLKVLCGILLAFTTHAYAAPIISGASGNWNDPATWNGGVVPVAGDMVTIANGHTVTVTTNAACAVITIGNRLRDQNTTLTVNPGVSLTLSGNITINAPLSGSTDNTLDVNAGIVSCYSLITTNSANNSLRSLVTISTGTLSCLGNFLMDNDAARNKLIFSGAGTLQTAGNSNTLTDAQFTPSVSTIDYNGVRGQNILPLSYYTLKCSGTSTKALAANTILTGNLLIAGSGVLDVTANNYSLTIAGNWSVTSLNLNPFLERKGTVTFNGSAGVQTLTTPLSLETFYNLIINNTAGNASADIQFNKNCRVTQAYTHVNGKVDLRGNGLSIISSNGLGVFTACNLSGGSIMSSVSGAQISFADAYDSTFVNFTGTKVGNNSIPVALTVNTGRINLENLILYGTGTFIKRHADDDVTAKGGNKFYGTVTFTLNPAAGNWYTGAGSAALPDSFFSKANFYSYAANTNTRFILGAHSAGNYYADDVTLNVKSAGSILTGYSSGAANGTRSSHFFNKLADVSIAGAGNCIFGEGQALLPSTVTFNSTLRLATLTRSTGSIYIGKNNSGSSIAFTSTGSLTNGFLYGNTAIYLYNITQTGSLSQTLTNINTATSKIIVGEINGRCTWNGSVNFTAPVLDLAYNTFNGSNNVFNLKASVSPQSCTGGNTFAAGTTSTFTNFSKTDWYFAVVAPDDYNGDVLYRMNAIGTLYPAYNSNCTYAGNIIILPGSDTVIFSAAANGRVTIDGNQSTIFTNNGTKPANIKRLTMQKTAGVLSLYNNLFMLPGGNLTLTSGKIVTGAANMLILQDESCTVTPTTAASTSYVDGPMRIDVSSTSPQTIHFPIGKKNDSRPVDLTVQHTSNTSYSYTAEMVISSANALGWTNPASVYNTSALRWWDISRTVTSSGASAPATELVTSPLPVVSFYYGLNDRAANPVNVTICKNTYNASSTWIDIGATGATNGIGKITSVSSPSAFNSFSRFTIGFYGIPPAPTGRDSSICGTGSATITASPVYGEFIDWYAAATGGTALATNTTTFSTPVISAATTYYAQARNTKGYVSATRTPVKAFVYNTPTISSFSPATADAGTTVIINGANFNNNVSAVTFGGTAALSFTINSPTQISAVLGSGATGAVSVTNNCGTGSRTGFVYNPLTVWTGAINTSWTNAGNWDDGVPTIIHSAIIPSVTNQPLISSNQTIKSITIMTGATVDIAPGNSLNIKDSLTSNGDVIGGGTVTLSGTSSQPVRGNGTYTNLALNNNNGAVIGSGAGNMVNITGRYTPTAGMLTSNNHLTLKSTFSVTGVIAGGSAAGGYISGKVILERYIPARRAWRLINFPVTNTAAPDINTSLQEGAGGNAASNPNPGYGTHITGGTIANGFDQNPNNSASMKEWTGSGWQNITSTNTAVGNQFPYFLFVRGSRANNLNAGTSATADNTTLRVNANIKQGNQTLSVSGTGWQLTGNPFPSVVNLDAVAVNNSARINRNFVFWDPKLGGTNNVGGYVTASYNGAGYDFTPAPASSLSEYAQPFTGFYVDAVSAGNFTITESNKCNCGSGNVFRPVAPLTTTSKLQVVLHSVNTDGSTPVVDGTMVAFDDRYNNDKDSYDAAKLVNTIVENIAVSRYQKKFSIERRKAVAGADTVFLNIANMKIKNYQLEIQPENFDTVHTVAYLEDSYTNQRQQVDLSAGSTFSFSIVNTPAAYEPGRFRIVLEQRLKSLPAKSLERSQLVVQQKSIRLLQNPVTDNTIKLQMQSQPKGSYTITILNNEGKEIATKQFSHEGVDAVKMIAIKKYLPKGLFTVIVKDLPGNATSFNMLVQ